MPHEPLCWILECHNAIIEDYELICIVTYLTWLPYQGGLLPRLASPVIYPAILALYNSSPSSTSIPALLVPK